MRPKSCHRTISWARARATYTPGDLADRETVEGAVDGSYADIFGVPR